jgi:STE24 endopeptidase
MPSTPSSSIARRAAWNAGRFPWTSEISAMRRVSVSGGMRKVGYSLPVAAVAAVVAATAATLLLRPRGGLIEPAAVSATDYFSPAELERADDFRGPQRVLGLAGLGLSGVTLALIAFRPPRRLARARPVLGAAAAGGGIALVLVLVNLPLDAIRHDRAVDVGLSTQDWEPWLGDVTKTAGIGAVFAAGGAAVGVALWRRFGRRWWIPASVAVVAAGAVMLYASPLVIDPLFNRFDELPEGKLRSDVLELAQRADVDVGHVYRVDASRRTTGANAYVTGLGHTKRVVLYDNLIEDFTPAEVRSVVAHELGHVHYDDVPRGLLYLALITPFAMLLVQRMTERLAPDARGADLVPALAFTLAIVAFAGQVAGSYVSRGVEARADAFALRLTNDPQAFLTLEKRLALQNIADPDPPELLQDLFGTHPTTIERLGYGEAFER